MRSMSRSVTLSANFRTPSMNAVVGLSSPFASVVSAAFACCVSVIAAMACWRSEEHTSELQSLMRISYAVFCLTKKNDKIISHLYQSQRQHHTIQPVRKCETIH